MITAKLKGGLGNQMFQIATAYAAAKRSGREFGINYNLEHLSGQGHPHLKYKDNLFKNIPQTSETQLETYNEPHFHYAPIPDKDNIIIDGYFQSEKYFNDYVHDIKALFTFPDDIKRDVKRKYKKIKSALNVDKIVCVHVRRGEYLLPPYNEVHISLPKEYYITAMNKFKDDDVGFVVISDSMAWCQDNINVGKIVFCNSGYDFFTKPKTAEFFELFDLYLASQCNHNITSPSSFSWWGAWLNNNKDQKVICTDKWFGPGGPQDYYDIYCKEWVKI